MSSRKKSLSKKRDTKNPSVISGAESKNDPSDAGETNPHIIAIGASAGGLETLKILFTYSKPSSNMAFVVVTHLSHDHISLMPELLQQYTKMKVMAAVDKQEVLGNHVYVLPPKKIIYIQKGILYLTEQNSDNDINLPIDFFLRSLANDQGSKAICIILSGTGSDGTIGLRALHEKNGLVIVQTASSAKYDGMPKSAINTGLVDYILPPEKMYSFLSKYLEHVQDKSIDIEKSISQEVSQVLLLLNAQTGHDFSSYKTNTIYRRIQKRMNILQLDTVDFYINYLHKYPSEIEILFKELLINVTNFFRDPQAFEVLKEKLENILKTKSKDYSFRVWVPGCATGEEAYSIAIILQECMEKLKRYFNVQIFGTDIDSDAIEKARAGVYSQNISLDISAERLSKFFIKEDNHYKISLDIRKMIIFAVQNLIKDPPFTKLDLLSCRNLLIYFNSNLQKRVLPLFHYSLNQHGILFLGTSETIGGSADLFNLIDRKWKVFERQDNGSSSFKSVMDFPSSRQPYEIDMKKPIEIKTLNNDQKILPIIEKILLDSYAPPCVIIDDKENLVYIYGRLGKYLEFTSGEAKLQILDMVRTELKAKLSSAINKAQLQHREFVFNGIQLKDGKDFKYINLKVKPISDIDAKGRKLLLVIFEDVLPVEIIEAGTKKHGRKGDLDKKFAELERELKYTKENLQTTIEELETSNEELKSSNEELQSTNEELQSTNEEIETSKEELQSLNEELTTVNTELESRIEQLSSANDDIKNLLDNTEIATIFLDKDLCIKRFTPKATEIINLIPTDVGRPISHIVSNLQYDKLVEDARLVLRSLESKTTEVLDKSNHWHVIRIIPYRTVTNMIDGVVITFLNIQSQKQAEGDLLKNQGDLNISLQMNISLLNLVEYPALMLDFNGVIVGANNEFLKKFKLTNDILGHQIYKSKLNWDRDKIKTLIDTFSSHAVKNDETISTTFADFAFQVKQISPKILLLGLK